MRYSCPRADSSPVSIWGGEGGQEEVGQEADAHVDAGEHHAGDGETTQFLLAIVAGPQTWRQVQPAPQAQRHQQQIGQRRDQDQSIQSIGPGDAGLAQRPTEVLVLGIAEQFLDVDRSLYRSLICRAAPRPTSRLVARYHG